MTIPERIHLGAAGAATVFLIVAALATGGAFVTVGAVLTVLMVFAAGYGLGRARRRGTVLLIGTSSDLGTVGGRSLERLVRQQRQAETAERVGMGGYL